MGEEGREGGGEEREWERRGGRVGVRRENGRDGGGGIGGGGQGSGVRRENGRGGVGGGGWERAGESGV